MPEINQYTLTQRELLETLIKRLGVHEGRWALLANFAVGPAHGGPTSENSGPGLMMVLGQMGIQRAAPEAAGVVLDAAEINPLPSPKSSKKKA